MQSACNIAPLHTSLPGITAAEPVAGIVLGMILVAKSPGTLAAAQIVMGVAKKAKHEAKAAKSKTKKDAGKVKHKGKKVKNAAKH
jgi:hypothetical protein